jgi:heme oxygenase
MILDRLKQETRPQHAHLEELNALPRTLAEHVRLLERFLGFVGPWEERLAAALPPEDPLRAAREKTGWLRADLAFFGYTSVRLAALPRCTDFPATPTRVHLLGECYVLEGSTLGGQLIARHLATALGLAPGRGDAYFRGYGAETAARWQAFRAELARHSSPENDAIMIGAAQAMFAALGRWFGQRSAAAA